MATRTPQLSRRDAMKLSAAGVVGTSLSGWMGALASHAATTPAANNAQPKRCILLWMEGGPTHKDTFDMRPGTENGGPYRQIQTNVPGIQISEHFPQLARIMNRGAIIRSMSTGEGSHGRARYYLHTSYREGVGGLTYPSIGAIASKEIGNQNSPLPNFVTIGGRNAYGSGFLGPRHQPLTVVTPERGVENLRPFVESQQFNNRVGLLQDMESRFHRTHNAGTSESHGTTYRRAVDLMMDRGSQAFDISRESNETQARYGNSRFGQSCLLARRLVEAGVTFVEVSLGGWDTHNRNFERVQQLSGQVDPAMTALVTDLEQRGLLDSTLVIWMGEFGRTPRINSRPPAPGRDHYPRAWSTVWFGGGINAGRVVGRTDAEAATVVERPVNTLDYMATICRVMGIDYTRFNQTPIGRPIRIVDRGANHITELVS